MSFNDGGDVADSTDWLGTSLACLMPVEQAFRCHVCKDFYNSPMITSCNHTFCSLCIRRCLSVDGKCPLCRMTDQESKLRGNWALREAIDAFCKARMTVLEVARSPPSPPVTTTTTLPPPSKRKTPEETISAAPGSSQEEPQAKRTRMSSRLSKTKAEEAMAMIAQEEVIGGEPIIDTNSEDTSEVDMDYEPDDGLVACPICQKRMKLASINGHLDSTCSGSPQRAKTTVTLSKTQTSTTKPFSASSAPLPPPERLPSLSYSLLNDGALRKKMAALGISASGSRQLLERRHKEWTTIWNANCDSAVPRRKAELLHDLDIWERTIGGGVLVRTVNGGTGRGSSTLTSRSIAVANQQAAMIKDKDFDGTAWTAKHSTSFQDLIANARKSRAKQQETKVDDKEPDKDQQAAESNASENAPSRGEQQLTDGATIPNSTPTTCLFETADSGSAIALEMIDKENGGLHLKHAQGAQGDQSGCPSGDVVALELQRANVPY